MDQLQPLHDALELDSELLLTTTPAVTSAAIRDLDEASYEPPISTVREQHLSRFMADVVSRQSRIPQTDFEPPDFTNAPSVRSSAATISTRSVVSSDFTFYTAESKRPSYSTYVSARESTTSAACQARESRSFSML